MLAHPTEAETCNPARARGVFNFYINLLRRNRLHRIVFHMSSLLVSRKASAAALFAAFAFFSLALSGCGGSSAESAGRGGERKGSAGEGGPARADAAAPGGRGPRRR